MTVKHKFGKSLGSKASPVRKSKPFPAIPRTKKRYKCYGGPYDGATIQLTTPNTIPFSAKGMKGRYRAGVKVKERVRKNGKSVTIVSAYATNNPACADCLLWEPADG